MPKETTRVVFRIWNDGSPSDGEAIALFPDQEGGRLSECGCYMHIGQHGAAYYAGVIAMTRKPQTDADLAEVAALRAELESIGYILREYVRRPPR